MKQDQTRFDLPMDFAPSSQRIRLRFNLVNYLPEMFSEEFQAEMIARYIEVLRSKPNIVGEHVWNLCDFKTGQAVRRAGGLNLKGVFTRDRRPKLAAHRLRELWQ